MIARRLRSHPRRAAAWVVDPAAEVWDEGEGEGDSKVRAKDAAKGRGAAAEEEEAWVGVAE